MFKALLQTLITLALLSWVLPTINFASWSALILAAIVFTLLFHLAKPVLNLLFLPVNIVTLGFFSAVINVVLLWLVQYLVPGFQIQNMVLFGLALNQFWTLMVVSALIGFTQAVIRKVF